MDLAKRAFHLHDTDEQNKEEQFEQPFFGKMARYIVRHAWRTIQRDNGFTPCSSYLGQSANLRLRLLAAARGSEAAHFLADYKPPATTAALNCVTCIVASQVESLAGRRGHTLDPWRFCPNFLQKSESANRDARAMRCLTTNYQLLMTLHEGRARYLHFVIQAERTYFDRHVRHSITTAQRE